MCVGFLVLAISQKWSYRIYVLSFNLACICGSCSCCSNYFFFVFFYEQIVLCKAVAKSIDSPDWQVSGCSLAWGYYEQCAYLWAFLCGYCIHFFYVVILLVYKVVFVTKHPTELEGHLVIRSGSLTEGCTSSIRSGFWEALGTWACHKTGATIWFSTRRGIL